MDKSKHVIGNGENNGMDNKSRWHIFTCFSFVLKAANSHPPSFMFIFWWPCVVWSLLLIEEFYTLRSRKCLWIGLFFWVHFVTSTYIVFPLIFLYYKIWIMITKIEHLTKWSIMHHRGKIVEGISKLGYDWKIKETSCWEHRSGNSM